MKYLTPDPAKALPCIVCDKQMDNEDFDTPNQPSNGLAFFTDGHYGSTVFDPVDGSAIEITVCDDCIRAKASTHVNYYAPPELDPDQFEEVAEQATESRNNIRQLIEQAHEEGAQVARIDTRLLESFGVTHEQIANAIRKSGNMMVTPEQLGIDPNEMRAMIEYLQNPNVTKH